VENKVAYAFKFNSQLAYFNLRGYWDFWAQQREEGPCGVRDPSIPLAAGH
jgi:hypothetical protein